MHASLAFAGSRAFPLANPWERGGITLPGWEPISQGGGWRDFEEETPVLAANAPFSLLEGAGTWNPVVIVGLMLQVLCHIV